MPIPFGEFHVICRFCLWAWFIFLYFCGGLFNVIGLVTRKFDYDSAIFRDSYPERPFFRQGNLHHGSQTDGQDDPSETTVCHTARHPLAECRPDTGALWENWMVGELRKKQDLLHGNASLYFWRTTTQKKIDCIEERDGIISAYEFKWNTRKKSHKQDAFLAAYPNATLHTVTPDNYFEFLSVDTIG